MGQLQTQLSTTNWRWRTVRLIGVVAGSLMTISGVTDAKTWGQFWPLLTPVVVLGLVVTLTSAVLTGVDSPGNVDPAQEGGDS